MKESHSTAAGKAVNRRISFEIKAVEEGDAVGGIKIIGVFGAAQNQNSFCPPLPQGSTLQV